MVDGSFSEALGQVVAAFAEAGQVVVVALQVVDALADLEQVVRR